KRLSLLDRAPRTTGRSTQWRLPPSAIRRNGTEGRTGPGRFPTEPGTLLAQILLLPSGASEILLGHSGLLVGDTMGHPQDRLALKQWLWCGLLVLSTTMMAPPGLLVERFVNSLQVISASAPLPWLQLGGLAPTAWLN